MKLTPLQNEMVAQFDNYGLEIGDAYKGAIHALQQQEYTDWHVHFAHSLREVIDLLARHRQTPYERKNSLNYKKRKALLQSVIDPIGRQAYSMEDKYEQLCSTYDELSSIAHHRKKISREEACEKLSDVEEILRLLTRPQIVINKEIDAIALKLPSVDLAKKLVGMLFRMSTQDHLIAVLPECWLPCMRDAGFFSTAPDANLGWIQSKYLRKCAINFEADVCDIILSCKFSNGTRPHSGVCRNFLVCASMMQACHMEQIAKKALDEQWGDYIGVYLEIYWAVATKLYSAGKIDTSVKMMHAVLKPKRPDERKTDDWYRVDSVLGEMMRLAKKRPLPIIKLADRLLHEYVVANNRNQKRSDDYDDEAAWRPTIQEFVQTFDSPTTSLIVNCIRDCIPYSINDASELTQIMMAFYKRNHYIYRKIEIYVYTKYPNMFKKEIVTSVFVYFGNRHVFYEYLRLLERVFGLLPESAKQDLLNKIETEPALKLAHMSAIQNHLDSVRLSEYRELLKKAGESDVSDSVLPNAGYAEILATSDRFDDKSPDQVFETVKNHRIQEQDPSDLSVLEEFEGYVADNPGDCSKRALCLVSADTRVQHGLLKGLWTASGSAHDIQWDGVLSLIKHMVDLSERMNSDTTVLVMCWLVEKALKMDLIDFGLNDKIREIVHKLVDIGTQSRETYLKERSWLDGAMNSINGSSFLVLCQYAAWCQRQGAEKTLAHDVKQSLNSYLNDGSRHTVTRHVVLGVFLTDFYNLDPELAESIRSKIRSGEECKLAFWEGYISSPVYRHVFNDLVGLYDEFFNKNLKGGDWKRLHELTVVHVMLAYFYDFEEADRLVEKFLRKDKYVETCVSKISVIIKDRSDDPNFNKKKLADLWTRDSFARHDLGMWLAHSPLEPKLTVSLCLKHARNHPGRLDLFIYVGALASYVEDFPVEVVDCLGVLMNKRDTDHIPSEMRGVLLQLLDSGNTQVVDKCKMIIENLIQLEYDGADLLTKHYDDYHKD